LGPADEFLLKYGENGYLVLKAVLAASTTRLGGPRMGDFSFRDVKEYLEKNGVRYNPSLLLSKLEREYGLIETTYKSGGQHWWKIVDPEEIERAVSSYEGADTIEEGEEPARVKLLRIQFYSLEPERILETLYRLSRRRRLSEPERRLLRRLAFEDLPLLVRFLEEATAEYPEELEAEIAMAETILDMVEKLTSTHKMPSTRRASSENAPLSSIREPIKERFKRRL
jgi:hypothetical protein